jgi:DNA polymerase III subunit epsilon
MYAIVDIETTGGYASGNDITEIAIVFHDGGRITGTFESLIKPSVPIPYFIQTLTGINDEMVADAPAFKDIAPIIYEKLKGRIFVAHNVNFDYSFVKHHLSVHGFDLVTPKLCTVRLSRKVFPDLSSYSLGNLCRQKNILIQNRHRAGGDALATAELFTLIVSSNGGPHIEAALKKKSREQSLPPNLPKEQIEQLPYCPGVYYFHDRKGKIIYVGKAKNIKYRVSSHFTHNGTGRQRQEFLRNIHSISHQNCGTELMAFILENIEIRKYWPRYNSSQKVFTQSYGLYMYEDSSGYLRLFIEKKKQHLKAYYTFNLLTEGLRVLNQLVKQFDLCPKLANLESADDPCSGRKLNTCLGACEKIETPREYNHRVLEAIDYLEQLLPTFAVMDESIEPDGKSCILIEKGRFYGMGYMPGDAAAYSAEELKSYLQAYPENDYIRGLVYQYVQRKPEKKLVFS